MKAQPIMNRPDRMLSAQLTMRATDIMRPNFTPVDSFARRRWFEPDDFQNTHDVLSSMHCDIHWEQQHRDDKITETYRPRYACIFLP